MPDKIVRTPEEIEDLYIRARSSETSRYPGMTYEEGITTTIEWLTDKDINIDEIV